MSWQLCNEYMHYCDPKEIQIGGSLNMTIMRAIRKGKVQLNDCNISNPSTQRMDLKTLSEIDLLLSEYNVTAVN